MLSPTFASNDWREGVDFESDWIEARATEAGLKEYMEASEISPVDLEFRDAISVRTVKECAAAIAGEPSCGALVYMKFKGWRVTTWHGYRAKVALSAEEFREETCEIESLVAKIIEAGRDTLFDWLGDATKALLFERIDRNDELEKEKRALRSSDDQFFDFVQERAEALGSERYDVMGEWIKYFERKSASCAEESESLDESEEPREVVQDEEVIVAKIPEELPPVVEEQQCSKPFFVAEETLHRDFLAQPPAEYGVGVVAGGAEWLHCQEPFLVRVLVDAGLKPPEAVHFSFVKRKKFYGIGARTGSVVVMGTESRSWGAASKKRGLAQREKDQFNDALGRTNLGTGRGTDEDSRGIEGNTRIT